MDRTGLKQVNKPTRYFGVVCNKHPELEGERMISNRKCVKCLREAWCKMVLKKKNENPEGYADMVNKKRLSQIERRLREREEVFNHYGNECCLCGYKKRWDVLTIDHIDQNGAAHRKSNGRRCTGVWLYRWLLNNGLPDGFRTLCPTCQAIEYIDREELNGTRQR